jgi:hypothetical protein
MVGEGRVVGAQHHIAHHGEFGVDGGRTVDRSDHRHFDIEQAGQHLAALPMDARSRFGRGVSEGLDINCGAEFLAGAGHYNRLVVVVGAQVGERVANFGVELAGKLERVALGMDRQLNDAVTPFEPDVLIFVLVIFEFDQRVGQAGHKNYSPAKIGWMTLL